jgi:hypothetical protein
MSESASRYIDGVPVGESDRFALVFEKPRLWEYALFGSVLVDQLTAYESVYRDYLVGYIAEAGPRVRLPELGAYLSDASSQVLLIVRNFNKLLNGSAQTRAFGAPGQPGDAMLIEHLARRLIDIYGDLLAWAAGIRGTRVDADAERAVELLAQYVDSPIHAIRDFVDDYVQQVNEIPAALRLDTPKNPIEITMSIVLEIPDSISQEFHHEMDRLAL